HGRRLRDGQRRRQLRLQRGGVRQRTRPKIVRLGPGAILAHRFAADLQVPGDLPIPVGPLHAPDELAYFQHVRSPSSPDAPVWTKGQQYSALRRTASATGGPLSGENAWSPIG